MLVKITTPDGKIPSSSNPKEGVDYEISQDQPKTGDLVFCDGVFKQYIEPPLVPTDPVVPVEPEKPMLEQIMDRLSAIEAKLDA
jgi:hypothetical protein